MLTIHRPLLYIFQSKAFDGVNLLPALNGDKPCKGQVTPVFLNSLHICCHGCQIKIQLTYKSTMPSQPANR